MNTYIALIRGINLVGRRSLPMKELKVMCEGAGCRDVRTYIQSGNVIFRSAATDVERLSKRLAKMIFTSRGFEPYVLVLTRDELKRAAARNPFPEATANHKSLHLFFMGQTPKPDLEKLEAVRAKSERFQLVGKTFYLHTPDGFGKSKLAQRAERLLGVEATARNWRTVTTLIEMSRSYR